MGSLNTARAILVGGAVIAALVATAYQHWASVAILVVGLAGHGALWLWLYRRPSRSPQEPSPSPGGTDT